MIVQETMPVRIPGNTFPPMMVPVQFRQSSLRLLSVDLFWYKSTRKALRPIQWLQSVRVKVPADAVNYVLMYLRNLAIVPFLLT